MSLTWARSVVSNAEERIPEDEYRDLKRIHSQLRFQPGVMWRDTEVSVLCAGLQRHLAIAVSPAAFPSVHCVSYTAGLTSEVTQLWQHHFQNVLTTLKKSPSCSHTDGSSVCKVLFFTQAIIKTWQIPALHKYCHSRKNPQSTLSSHMQCQWLNCNERVWDISLTIVQQSIHTQVQACRKVRNSSNKPFLKWWLFKMNFPVKNVKNIQNRNHKTINPYSPRSNKHSRLLYLFCLFFFFFLLCWSWWHVFDTESKVNICQYLELVHVPMNGPFKNPLGCFDWFTYLESLAAGVECLPWERLRVLEILLPSALKSVRTIQEKSNRRSSRFLLSLRRHSLPVAGIQSAF